MAKEDSGNARDQANSLKGGSTAQTQANIYGGPNSAFGPGGLSGTYSDATSAALKGAKEGMETGGYDPVALQKMRDITGNYALTGGVDPAAVARFTKLAQEGPDISTEATGALKDLISGGGLSPESASLYKNFIKTGGYSDQDKQSILRQATSGVKGSFNVLGQQARRAAAATGGMGGAAATASLGRGALQQQAETTTNALNDINAQQRANELKGAAGLDEGTKNVLAATQGLTQQDILREQGQVAGAQGLNQIGGLKLSGQALQQQLEGGVAGNKLNYTALTNLIGSQAGQQILAMLGIDSSNQQAAMDAFVKLSQNPTLFQQISQGIAQIGAGVASVGSRF